MTQYFTSAAFVMTNSKGVRIHSYGLPPWEAPIMIVEKRGLFSCFSFARIHCRRHYISSNLGDLGAELAHKREGRGALRCLEQEQ